jgi:hypothetical protein
MRLAFDFWHGLNTGIGERSTFPKAGPESSSTTTDSPWAKIAARANSQIGLFTKPNADEIVLNGSRHSFI